MSNHLTKAFYQYVQGTEAFMNRAADLASALELAAPKENEHLAASVKHLRLAIAHMRAGVKQEMLTLEVADLIITGEDHEEEEEYRGMRSNVLYDDLS